MLALESNGFREETTRKTICRFYDISQRDLHDRINHAKKTTGIVILGRDLLYVDNSMKKRKSHTRFIMKNIVKSNEKNKGRCHIFLIHDNKKYSSLEFSKKLGVDRGNLNAKVKGVKSATINGHDVEIVLEEPSFKVVMPFVYNGKDLYKDVTYLELCKITNKKYPTIQRYVQEDRLEKSTGFKVYKTDPTKGA